MTHLLSNRWKILVMIFTLLLVSLACLIPTGAISANPHAPVPQTVQADMALGAGTFSFPNTEAGLADLSSYKASLTLAFEGTRAGKPQKWSKTYVMLATAKPPARQLTIEKTGDLSDLAPVFMAEANGAAYQRSAGNACNATVLNPANSLAGQLEPAGFLTGVVGAQAAGSATINGTATKHYTFDERALGQSGQTQSKGELWVASDGGYVVKDMVTTKGNTDYFGEGIEGTLTWDYELTDVNKPVEINLPADCPAGMVNAPQLSDASNVINMPSILTYETTSSPADAAAFYQKQIPGLGWKLLGKPTVVASMALLSFTQGDQELTITITATKGVTKVRILQGRAQK